MRVNNDDERDSAEEAYNRMLMRTGDGELLDIDVFFDAYLTCALWSSVNHDTDEPFDADYDTDDIAPEALAELREGCVNFLTDCADDLAGMDASQAGHDFWLTRNGHGAGFWDRGLGERGKRLSKASRTYGEVNLYVGDDGKLYI